MKKLNLNLALVHFPVTNKRGEEIATSVTNLDLHDISRSCRTFGLNNYYVVTPNESQHDIIKRILGYWETDDGNIYNPDRADALGVIRLSKSLEDAENHLSKKHGKKPMIIGTGANLESGVVPEVVKSLDAVDDTPILLLFGTGWGLSASVFKRCQFSLEPIFGNSADGYNHLSVRSAVAIYLDRLTRSL